MDLLNDFISIGFTEYEARVYLALLHSSPATGYQIGKAAGVPRSMVYEALGRLSVRGAVLKTEEARGTLYRPLPPEVLLNRYAQEHQRVLDHLRVGLEALYTSQDEELIWSVSGRESVLSYAAHLLREAEVEVLGVLSDPSLEALRGEIESAAARGVSVSTLLTGSGPLNAGRVSRHAPMESELQNLQNFLLLVVDNRESLIGREDNGVSATITRNRNIVLIARQFVWMELFTQRIYKQLGAELLLQIDPEDRQFFENLGPKEKRARP